MKPEIVEKKHGDFLISSDPERLQIDRIHQYLSKESYWSIDIPKSVVIKSIEHSLCFGIYDMSLSDQPQIGFSRVVTDFSTFGWVCDVYIEEPYRGKGLSRWMMKVLLEHPQLQGLRRICLATVAAHKLYEKVGFKVMHSTGGWMEIKDNDIYKKLKEKKVA